jgi:hypothetical protein
MSQTITVEIPDALAQSAQAVADRTDRRLEDVIVEWLGRFASELPIEALPDEQVLALRDLQLPAPQQAELDDLLAAQREGQLSAARRARLDTLMGLYRKGMVSKARALKVAVDRGLQPPLGQE